MAEAFPSRGLHARGDPLAVAGTWIAKVLENADMWMPTPERIHTLAKMKVLTLSSLRIAGNCATAEPYLDRLNMMTIYPQVVGRVYCREGEREESVCVCMCMGVLHAGFITTYRPHHRDGQVTRPIQVTSLSLGLYGRDP